MSCRGVRNPEPMGNANPSMLFEHRLTESDMGRNTQSMSLFND